MQNLIENQSKQTKKGDEDGEEKKKRPVIKSATDLQRLKLEKLMKNPDKPIIIPEAPREKDYMQTVPSFVRNVMGSSAGAGSGEFHVYRHLRRKEYARQKCIQAKSMREQLDDEYQSKLEKNRLEAVAKTAKKRAKRLKKKQRGKKPKTQLETQTNQEKEESSDEDDDVEEEDQSVNSAAVDPVNKDTVETSVETENSLNNAGKTNDENSEQSDEVPEAKEKIVQEDILTEIVAAPETEKYVETDSPSQREAVTLGKSEENKQ